MTETIAPYFSHEIQTIICGILILLTVVSSIFFTVKKIKGPGKLIDELIHRTFSWWVIVGIVTVFFFFRIELALIGVGLMSFFSLRELSGHMKLRDSDKHVLMWCYLAIPIQLFFVSINYLMGVILFIPVIMFIFISFLNVAGGDVRNITRSIGVLHWCAMVTVYSFSHLAYLLIYPFPHIEVGHRANLLIFLLILTELNDVFQFIWGKLFGKHPIVPKVSPKKTIEGFLGGLISTTLLGYGLRFLIPLPVDKVVFLAALIGFVGFYGDVTLSAVKREHEIKDMSNLIPGHGGLMDRLDSLAFTSIAFFYLVRLWSGG